jgi:hypothetical protein
MHETHPLIDDRETQLIFKTLYEQIVPRQTSRNYLIFYMSTIFQHFNYN